MRYCFKETGSSFKLNVRLNITYYSFGFQLARCNILFFNLALRVFLSQISKKKSKVQKYNSFYPSTFVSSNVCSESARFHQNNILWLMNIYIHLTI